jgi:hypothetical protein
LRSLRRPLPALLASLSNKVLRQPSSPEFLNPPAPTIHAPNPNPTQNHALDLATFAGELLEVFDQLGLGINSDARGGGLKLTREALWSVITRIIHPLVAGIKAELVLLIEALEVPPRACTPKFATYSKTVNTQRPSILALEGTIPVHAHPLIRFFPTTCTWSRLSSLEISVAWRALVTLTHRTLSHILSKSRTYWRKREEGSCCGHYTTNHALIDAVSSQIPTISSSLPSTSVNRRVTYRQ